MAQVRVLRGRPGRIESRLLVPDDLVEIQLASIVVLADCISSEAANLSINEASLTGESLPKEKKPATPHIPVPNVCIATLNVTATGAGTRFGENGAPRGGDGQASSRSKKTS